MNGTLRDVLLVVNELALLIGFVLVAGPLATWVTMTPNGRYDRRQLLLVDVGGFVLGVATLASPFLVAGDAPLFDAVTREAWAATLVRLAVLLALLAWLDELVSGPILGSRRAWAAVVVVVLSVTFVLPSELVAEQDGIFRVVVAVALFGHVLAAAVWLGGALVIAVAGLPLRDLNGLGSVVRSFSQITLATVVTVAVSSTVLVVAGAGDPGELLTSGYGALLVVKVAVFAGMVVVANHGRHNLDVIVLHRLRTGGDSLSRVQAWSLLTGAQLVSGAVLLLATVALVALGPPA